ncbi:hypothetical protein GCM10023238_08780 [Streptomyces heliomycini]
MPEGGSLGLARSVEERYRRLGGEITYNAKVDEVLVEDDRAVGVRLSDGREFRADIVVSACDGRTTMLELLKGRYLNTTYERLYTRTIDEPGMLYPGYVSVFLGLDRSFPQGEPCTTYLLDEKEAASFAGMGHPSMNVQFRSAHYPELSPRGTSVVFVTYFSDTGVWRELTDDRNSTAAYTRGRNCTRWRCAAAPRTTPPSGRFSGPSRSSWTAGSPAGGVGRGARHRHPAHPGPLHRQPQRDHRRLASVHGRRGKAGEGSEQERSGGSGAEGLLPLRHLVHDRRAHPGRGGGPSRHPVHLPRRRRGVHRRHRPDPATAHPDRHPGRPAPAPDGTTPEAKECE